MTEPAYSMEYNGATESEVTVTPPVEPVSVGEYKEPGHWEQHLPQVHQLGFGLISEGWTLMQEGADRHYYYQVVVGNDEHHVKIGQRLDLALVGKSPISLMAHVTNLVWVKLLFALIQGRPADPTTALPAVETEPELVPEPEEPEFTPAPNKHHYHVWDGNHEELGVYRTKKMAMKARSEDVRRGIRDMAPGDFRPTSSEYYIDTCHEACLQYVEVEPGLHVFVGDRESDAEA